MIQVVDIADFAVTADTTRELVTYSLGSCVAVAIWDPEIRVGGLVHCMLPEASLSPAKAKANPAMFADAGAEALLIAAQELGVSRKRLVIKVAGGGQLLDDNGTFNIGRRNYLALRKFFWKNNLQIAAESVGGSMSRTMKLWISSGKTTVKIRGEEFEL